MSFDPSVISDIGASGPDLAGSAKKGFQLKDMADAQQLSQLKLGEEKATLADADKAKGILSGSDLSTDKGVAEASEKLNKAGLSKQGMDLRKQAASVQSGELDNKLKNIDLHSAAHDIITSNVDQIWQQATAMKNEKTPDGRPKYTEASINAWIQGQVPLKLSAIQSDSGLPDDVKKIALQGATQFTQGNGGQITYDTLTQIERNSKQGQALFKSVRDDLTAQTGQKREEAYERSVDDQIKNRDRKTRGDGSSDQQAARGDLLASMGVAGVNLPQRNKQALNDTLDALYRKYPDKTADEIAQGIKTGQLSMATGKTEAGVLGRREAAILPVEKSITKPGGFLDQAEAAVNKVDFSKLKAAGAFQSWTKEQNSDPALTAYKAAVAELRAEYSIVLSKGGQVTDAARHEAEKVIPDLITKEQFKSIKNTVRQGIEASKSGVEESIAGVEGKGDDGGTHPAGIQSLLDKYK
jgi:hypothetical protein